MLKRRQPLLVDVEWRRVRALLLVQKADGAVEVLKLLVVLHDGHLAYLRRQVKLVTTRASFVVELDSEQLVDVLIRLFLQCLNWVRTPDYESEKISYQSGAERVCVLRLQWVHFTA